MLDIQKFLKDGWCIVNFPRPIEMSGIYFRAANLANCHYVFDDNKVKREQIEISKEFWEREYCLYISRTILHYIHQLLGLDIMVQYYPYFRIARPNKPQDNIGYHKDTQYGQTPYELAVHIPFVDLDERSAIRVISGSHIMPENMFPRVTGDGPLIEKGSIENRIGKPYAPKRLLIPDGMEATPLVMKVGQAAIFSPAIFHGQEINEGDVTRVSCDIRFISSHHSDKVRVGKTHAGYVPISQNPIGRLAKQYYEKNPPMIDYTKWSVKYDN